MGFDLGYRTAVEGDAGLGVEDGRVWVSDEVGGDDVLVCVGQDPARIQKGGKLPERYLVLTWNLPDSDPARGQKGTNLELT